MDSESLIAAAHRAQQAEDGSLSNCSRIWHVGFFFDGIHRNIEQDAPENRLSNVGRLFRAFPDLNKNTSRESYDAFYISGLGTPFHENLTSKLHAIMDGAQGSALDDLKDLPGDIAKEAGIEFFKTGKWWEVLKDVGKKLINPTEWAKLTGDITKSAVKKVSIEATPWLRDNPVIADMLVTGVDTRITSTKTSFEEAFKEAKNKSQVPIKLISFSLFGYDLGATLARKFLDTLLDDICQKQGDKYVYQGIPVEIIFAGLFDCARHTPASNNNGVDWFVGAFGGPIRGISILLGDKYVDQDTPLPAAVKSALHLAAAHETRVWRSLYRLGGDKQKYREELLPGCSEDVGGGLKPDEQKPSAELCRVALHRMYREATLAGVPFPDFQTLDKTDTDVASYFIMENGVKEKSVAQWTALYQQAVPFKNLSVAAQNLHLDSYIDWLGRQFYLYRSQCLKYSEQRGQVMASAGASAGLLGISPKAQEIASDIRNEIDILRKHWGWLDDVHRAALSMQNAMEMPDSKDIRRQLVPDVYIPALRRAKKFLTYGHAAYEGLPPPWPEDSAPSEIYAWFVHDVQKVDKGAGISEDFLVIRSMEMPES
ncbi:DUF2235 domain-containing protein [Rahnella bonaserana]|uniref:phospholipase effector Tle1 domain-containing protein n=1 Tax=Rahnella bonaserana TaxID=2816248 RepID=UPI0024C24AA8|nr:DUF2235 domain-containing protein [Rahnella bonaserana]WHZ40842.1 DUF2235 domain-containing protein [Rahnella bonaserana]